MRRSCCWQLRWPAINSRSYFRFDYRNDIQDFVAKNPLQILGGII